MLKRRARGVTLPELLVVLAIMAMLVGMGAPSLYGWLQNTRMRAAGESVLAGINRAKTEAINRNAWARFQFTSTLEAGCALATNSSLWVVNIDPSGPPAAVAPECDAAPSATVPPRILARSDTSAPPAGLVVDSNGTSSIVFNALGMPTPPPAGNILVDITNPTAGACATPTGGGNVQCMRIVISPAGQVRMCNPRYQLPHPQGC